MGSARHPEWVVVSCVVLDMELHVYLMWRNRSKTCALPARPARNLLVLKKKRDRESWSLTWKSIFESIISGLDGNEFSSRDGVGGERVALTLLKMWWKDRHQRGRAGWWRPRNWRSNFETALATRAYHTSRRSFLPSESEETRKNTTQKTVKQQRQQQQQQQQRLWFLLTRVERKSIHFRTSWLKGYRSAYWFRSLRRVSSCPSSLMFIQGRQPAGFAVSPSRCCSRCYCCRCFLFILLSCCVVFIYTFPFLITADGLGVNLATLAAAAAAAAALIDRFVHSVDRLMQCTMCRLIAPNRFHFFFFFFLLPCFSLTITTACGFYRRIECSYRHWIPSPVFFFLLSKPLSLPFAPVPLQAAKAAGTELPERSTNLSLARLINQLAGSFLTLSCIIL